MERVYTGTAVQNLTPAEEGGLPGYFTKGLPNGDPPVPATTPGADWFNTVQEEIANVIAGAGIALDRADRAQMLAAINALIAAGLPALGTAAFKDWGNGVGQLPEVEAATGKLNPAIIPMTGLDAWRKSTMLNGLMDASRAGAASKLLNGYADPFVDLSRIDTGLSSSYLHDAAGTFIHNPASSTTYSSAGAWNGATSAFSFSGADLYAAHSINAAIRANASFDGDFTVEWTWTQGQAQTVVGLGLVSADGSFDSANPNAYGTQRFDVFHWAGLLQFACPGQTYGGDGTSAVSPIGKPVKLERVGTAIRFWVDGILIKTFTASSSAPLRIYTAFGNTSPETDFDDFRWGVPGVAGALDLVSKPVVTTLASPDNGYLLAIIQPMEAVTYATDVTVQFTRVDGGPWVQAEVVTKIGVTQDGHDVVWASAAFTGATGTAFRYRLAAPNGKYIKAHGAFPDAD